MKSIEEFTDGMGVKRNYFDTHPDHKQFLDQAIEYVFQGGCSITAGSKWLKEEAGLELSDSYLRGLIKDGIDRRISNQ